MAKKSLSVTLEETTISNLQILAEEEMRSVSNLIDYIVAQYAKKHSLSASLKLNKVSEFTDRIKITPHGETQKALLGNVTLDDDAIPTKFVVRFNDGTEKIFMFPFAFITGMTIIKDR